MSQLIIDLVTPSGMVLEATELPDDMLTEEVIAELVDELGLPRLAPDGATIPYALEAGERGALVVGSTLRQCGVANGDRVRLTTSHALGRAAQSAPEFGPLAAPVATGSLAPGNVEVVLSVLDLNRSERTTLSSDRSVAELLQQIAGNFDLPARDKLGELISYRLESKALGRFLANRETLRQAGVPRLDRLTVHREEHAGAARCS
jgi:hypothetical protein